MKRATETPKPDRLPPHSIEAEQAVLGCVLLSPECLTECLAALVAGGACFYDLRHQIIFRALVELKDARVAIDPITLHERLKASKVLEQAGGLAYVAGLPDCISSAAGLDYYLQIVVEKFRLRRMIQTCASVVQRIHENEGSVDDLMAEIQPNLLYALTGGAARQTRAKTISELLDFDVDTDDNTVVGVRDQKTTRYMCRGQGGWLIGASGIGKSTLGLQMAISFALGSPFFGCTPAGPQKIIYVQAENDDGDNAEHVQGICAAMSISPFLSDGKLNQLDSNLRIITERELTGQIFVSRLEREIAIHEATMVFCDPFFAFAGVDITKTAETTAFLRTVLNPMLARSGCVFIGLHHKGKPSAKEPKNPSLYDLMYEGIGSSELVNWARFVTVLQPLDYPNFKLSFAKRGSRAWATHPNGEPATEIFLQHSSREKGIAWIQVDPPKVEEKQTQEKEKVIEKTIPEKIASMNLSSFLAACGSEGKREIMRRLDNWLCKENKLSVSDGSLFSAIGLMIKNGKLTKVDNKFTKGPNA